MDHIQFHFFLFYVSRICLETSHELHCDVIERTTSLFIVHSVDLHSKLDISRFVVFVSLSLCLCCCVGKQIHEFNEVSHSFIFRHVASHAYNILFSLLFAGKKCNWQSMFASTLHRESHAYLVRHSHAKLNRKPSNRNYACRFDDTPMYHVSCCNRFSFVVDHRHAAPYTRHTNRQILNQICQRQHFCVSCVFVN